VEFHAVSQHDETGEEPHRPQRRRHHQGLAEVAPAPLQLVETQVEVQPVASLEDELPRRTKPRRRRGALADTGPLQLVETEAADTQAGESPPAA
jgi:hypothetical protein